MSRGGKRKGAGRPLGSKSGVTKRKVMLSLDIEDAEKLKRIAPEGMSAWVGYKIKEAPEK